MPPRSGLEVPGTTAQRWISTADYRCSTTRKINARRIYSDISTMNYPDKHDAFPALSGGARNLRETLRSGVVFSARYRLGVAETICRPADGSSTVAKIAADLRPSANGSAIRRSLVAGGG